MQFAHAHATAHGSASAAAQPSSMHAVPPPPPPPQKLAATSSPLRSSSASTSSALLARLDIDASAGMLSAPPAGTRKPPRPAPSKGKQMPAEVSRVLLGWLVAHASHPYPSPEEKRLLMMATGLDAVQLRCGRTSPLRA
jgi:hypothetical protein